MTKPTKRRRPKQRRPDFFRKNWLSLLLLAFAGLLVASLVMLARVEEQPAPPALPPVVKKPPVDYSAAARREVEAFLAELSPEAGSVQRELEVAPVRYTLGEEFPPAERIADLRERLQRISSDYAIQLREANSLVVERARRAQIIIHFVPPAPLEPPVPAGPLLTIIMDDLGRSTQTARALLAMSQHVTFAILPGEPYAAEVADMAHASGREVMLHLPMEPQGYPAVNPGNDALFVKQSDLEILNNLDALLGRVPYASGANNHMGSRFTEDARALGPVMARLHEKGLFFIDSRTTGRSRVSEVARRHGVPTMDRDVFLDNVAEVEAISREILRLESKARQQGMAIGICHPYPETLEALRRELPGLERRGSTLVPVSVLLQKQAERQGS